MKQITIIIGLLLAVSANPSNSQEPTLKITGFSEDGEYLAYTLSGEHQGSAFPFAELHVFNTEEGENEESYFVTDESQSTLPDDLVRAILENRREVLEEYGIVIDSRGVPLEFPAMDSPPEGEILHFRLQNPSGGLPEGLYSLDLFETVRDSSGEYFGMHPAECELNLTMASGSGNINLLELSGDSLLRQEVYDFGLEELLVHPAGVMVVFLSCTVQGFETPETVLLPFAFTEFEELSRG